MSFILLSSITFLSAFLLFQIELIMAKLLLPTYGGSYLVWGACVVFFQGILLAGYLFAHQWITKKSIAGYLKIHFFLILLPFLFFPGRMIQIPHGENSLPLVIDIFIKLFLSIGPVFFTLSTISLVTQSWLSASKLKQNHNPYALYAVSNLGSFAGLLSYPFLFELFLTNHQQLNIWRLIYVILAVLNLIAFKMIPVQKMESLQEDRVPLKTSLALQWLCLSAAGVVLFLSVTNIMTYEIAPVPLLWIIPLSIYLLSFVLNFKNKPFMPGWISKFIFLITSFGVVYYFTSKMLTIPAILSAIAFNGILFVLCMYAQGELIRNKPRQHNLTLFYVMISLGGFIGGILTSWVIPVISSNLVEFLVGLLLLALGSKRLWLIVIIIIAIAFSSPIEGMIKNHSSIAKKRNYYGIYDIFDNRDVRIMLHGTTLHGIEFSDPKRKWIPLGYYSPTSPLGEALTRNIFTINRIAGIGLGAGTIAMYSSPTCSIDFYELDPDVIDLAKKHFGYLTLAPGEVKLLVGDARISLEKQKGVFYDAVIVDAFGGDSIPTHLVNRDVTALYKQHLNEGGAIFFHIPNRYFDLKPILAHIAQDLGGYAAFKSTRNEGLTMQTVWGIITWDQQKFSRLVHEFGWQPLKADSYTSIHPWSDDYSTILPIIRWDQLTDTFKHLDVILK
ncbi:MAG: fused MFS/spermidine synthase [Candidatus Omnitrophica bacterium]|nr:fused MFS/spermidine synthase [Candidatus Omnitrophota bacterium]